MIESLTPANTMTFYNILNYISSIKCLYAHWDGKYNFKPCCDQGLIPCLFTFIVHLTRLWNHPGNAAPDMSLRAIPETFQGGQSPHPGVLPENRRCSGLRDGKEPTLGRLTFLSSFLNRLLEQFIECIMVIFTCFFQLLSDLPFLS